MELQTGTLFNWRIEGENLLFITAGFSPLYGCMYHVDTKILSIYDYSESSDMCFSFYCETLFDAEKLVISFCKGNSIEILPAYQINVLNI